MRLSGSGTLVWLPFKPDIGFTDPLADYTFGLAPVFQTQFTYDIPFNKVDVQMVEDFSVLSGGFGTGQEERHDPGSPDDVRSEERQDARFERDQDAGPVARRAVGRKGPSMAQRRQPGQGQRQHPLERAPPGVRGESDAAGIVLIAPVVEGVGSSIGHRLDAGTSAGHPDRRPTVGRRTPSVCRGMGTGR